MHSGFLAQSATALSSDSSGSSGGSDQQVRLVSHTVTPCFSRMWLHFGSKPVAASSPGWQGLQGQVWTRQHCVQYPAVGQQEKGRQDKFLDGEIFKKNVQKGSKTFPWPIVSWSPYTLPLPLLPLPLPPLPRRPKHCSSLLIGLGISNVAKFPPGETFPGKINPTANLPPPPALYPHIDLILSPHFITPGGEGGLHLLAIPGMGWHSPGSQTQ